MNVPKNLEQLLKNVPANVLSELRVHTSKYYSSDSHSEWIAARKKAELLIADIARDYGQELKQFFMQSLRRVAEVRGRYIQSDICINPNSKSDCKNCTRVNFECKDYKGRDE